jgi:hypothetical protein
MLSDIINAEKLRLLAALDDTPEKKVRADLRRNKKKTLRFADGMAFSCEECGQTFDADWSLITAGDESTEDEHETYFAECPTCGVQAAMAKWYKAMFRSWARSRKDPELNARRAASFADTRTPEQNAISRFNGFLHGAYAKQKHLFPNVPGSKWCGGCEIDEQYCLHNPTGSCVKAAQSYLMRSLSIETGDPTVLNHMVAANQANADTIFGMMTHDLVRSGLKYSKPEYVNGESGPQIVRDENGEAVRIDYVNPLLPYWQRHIAMMNQTPADTNTSHKSAQKDDGASELLARNPEEDKAIQALVEKQSEAVAKLAEMVLNSQK